MTNRESFCCAARRCSPVISTTLSAPPKHLRQEAGLERAILRDDLRTEPTPSAGGERRCSSPEARTFFLERLNQFFAGIRASVRQSSPASLINYGAKLAGLSSCDVQEQSTLPARSSL